MLQALGKRSCLAVYCNDWEKHGLLVWSTLTFTQRPKVRAPRTRVALCFALLVYLTRLSAATITVFQSSLEVPLVKKMGTKFGPPGNVRLVYFIDDINLPMLDQYGTQSAIALLRQQMEYGRIYDRRKDFIEKHIQHAQFVACLNPAVGSFVINPRLQRHFTTFATGMPSKGALQEIYETFLLKRDEAGQIIGGHLCDWAAEFQNISKAIVNAALSLSLRRLDQELVASIFLPAAFPLAVGM